MNTFEHLYVFAHIMPTIIKSHFTHIETIEERGKLVLAKDSEVLKILNQKAASEM